METLAAAERTSFDDFAQGQLSIDWLIGSNAVSEVEAVY